MIANRFQDLVCMITSVQHCIGNAHKGFMHPAAGPPKLNQGLHAACLMAKLVIHMVDAIAKAFTK